jgi:hypothetical protein
MPDSTTATSLVPLLSAFGGYLIAAVTEYLRDQRARTREREARAEARKLQLFERRSDFQRETLLTLQEAVLQLARAAGRAHHLDEMEFRKTGKWGGNLYPEDLDNAAHDASVKTLMYMMRVRDDDVRELMKKFREHANQVGICRSREQSTQAIQEAIAVSEPLHERIGLILRKLDDDETLGLPR